MILPLFSIKAIKSGDVKAYSALWNMLKEKDLYKHLFYGGDIDDIGKFCTFMASGPIVYAIMFDNRKLAGMFYFTNFIGYTAQFHFCISRSFQRKLRIMKTQVFAQIQDVKRKDGTPLVTSLYGVTPAANRAALMYLKASGFEVKMRLPEACYMKYLDIWCDGVVSQYLFKRCGNLPHPERA
jgi:hypothetical protein